MGGQRLKNRESRYKEGYDELKLHLSDIGFILQGCLQKRYMKCGKSSCVCHADPDKLHGPYYHFTRKSKGKTVSVYLNQEKVALCEEWIANNRKLESLVKAMRKISAKLAKIYKIIPQGKKL